MAQALQFTKANNVLSVVDGYNNRWAYTGQCSLRMVVGDTAGATKYASYVLSCGADIIKFDQQDIYKIAGSDPSGTPATDFASIKAILPLYT